MAGDDDIEFQPSYYAVMWYLKMLDNYPLSIRCKKSNKKNKVWEGDAVLERQKCQWVLYDADGQVMSKSAAYAGETSLTEGQTLLLGKREIEVHSESLFQVIVTGKY